MPLYCQTKIGASIDDALDYLKVAPGSTYVGPGEEPSCDEEWFSPR